MTKIWMLLHLLVLKVGGWMAQMLLLVSCCSFLQVTTNGSWRHFPECLTSDSVSYFHTPIYTLISRRIWVGSIRSIKLESLKSCCYSNWMIYSSHWYTRLIRAQSCYKLDCNLHDSTWLFQRFEYVMSYVFYCLCYIVIFAFLRSLYTHFFSLRQK